MLGPGVSTMPSDSRAKASRLESSGMRGSGNDGTGYLPEPTANLYRNSRLFLHRRAQGDEFFGRRGVDADGFVEHLLGGAGLQGYGQALHDLAGVGAYHVAAQHAVGIGVHH